jgi:hypothetical protein
MNLWSDPPPPPAPATDWAAFKALIPGVATIEEAALVKQKSRDFY